MCKASEIHCRDSSCSRPIGWFVAQPCTPFLSANKGMPPAFDGSRDLNWNTSTSDCGVPRVVSTKKSACRTCQPCFWKTLCSNFALVQDWAYVAKTHRKWLEENPGDDLLWRRTKARLRREYDQSHSQGKKRKLADESFEMLTPPLSSQSSQPETSPNTSIYASTADNLGWYPTPPEDGIDPECLGPSVWSINPPGPTAASPGGQD